MIRIEDRHKGETIVVLGCGPSILRLHSPALREFTTIGVNRISQLFDPDYLVWIDTSVWENFKDIILASNAEKYCAVRVGNPILDGTAITYRRFKSKKQLLSPRFSDGLFWSATGIFPAINLAYLFGAKRIILGGLDLNDNSHFYPNAEQESPFPARDRILEHFTQLKDFADECGIEILNLNSNSAVRCFPFAEIVKTNGKYTFKTEGVYNG